MLKKSLENGLYFLLEAGIDRAILGVWMQAKMFLLGELSSLLTAVLWAGSSILYSEAIRRLESMLVNIVRLFLAAACFTFTILILDYRIDLSSTQALYLSLSGLIGLSVGDSFLFRAFGEIGPRISMLIMSSVPAIGAFLAYVFLDEMLSIRKIVGMIVTLTGIGIVVLSRRERPGRWQSASWRGAGYALLGAVGQAGGLICAKTAFNEGEINGFCAALIRTLASLVLLLPLTLFTRRLDGLIGAFAKDRRVFLLTTAASVLGAFLGMPLSLIAIAHASVGVAATLMATVPILILPFVHFVYKESLSWRAIAGACFAVGGVAILCLR